MTNERICIIGCGTYGSYLLKQLRRRHGAGADITVVEAGDEQIRDIEEAGLATPGDTSNVSRFGRYFGLGGTSARWGGQILFFDRRDVANNHDADWDYIVALNERHRGRVMEELLGKGKSLPPDADDRVKNGLWLGYFKRNLFKRLRKQDLAAVNWIKNHRVTGFHLDGTRLRAVQLRDRAGQEREVTADRFYLTAGALESCRLLEQLDSPTLRATELGENLGDHVSVELFRVAGTPPVLHGVDFTPRFIGTSLFTKRLLVETPGGRVNFAHVVPNKDVAAFSTLKSVMFGRQQGRPGFWEIMKSLSFLASFAGKLAFVRKLHIHQNRWSLQLDIEQGGETDNTVRPSDERDNFGERGLRIDWRVSDSDREAIAGAKEQIRAALDAGGHTYEELFTDIQSYEKMEDTYHPVGFIRMGGDERAPVDRDFRVRGTDNLYHFSTALFRSAKSINPTGAGFCLVEEHLANL